MMNLAGKTPEFVRHVFGRELEKAGVPIFSQPCSSGEVMQDIVGVMEFAGGQRVTFRRAWYYVMVSATQKVPQAVAAKLNKKWSAEVRVEGYAGGKEADQDVDSWHVDTQEGLNALATMFRENYGFPKKVQPLVPDEGILKGMETRIFQADVYMISNGSAQVYYAVLNHHKIPVLPHPLSSYLNAPCGVDAVLCLYRQLKTLVENTKGPDRVEKMDYATGFLSQCKVLNYGDGDMEIALKLDEGRLATEIMFRDDREEMREHFLEELDKAIAALTS